MPQAPMHRARLAAAMSAAALWVDVAIVCAQEVRINQYWDAEENPKGVGMSPLGPWFYWETGGEFCPGSEGIFRGTDLRGAFITSDRPAFESCGRSANEGALAVAANGGFLAVGIGDDADGRGIWGRAFDPTGSPISANVPINTVTTGWQRYPEVAYLESNRFAVVWHTDFAGTAHGRIVFIDGSSPGPQVDLSSTPEVKYRPSVAGIRGGGIIASWGHVQSTPPNLVDAHVRVYDDNFAPLGPENTINVSQCRDARPIPASTSLGFVVVWPCTPPGTLGNSEVMGRALDVTGVPQGSEFQINVFDASSQNPTAIAFDAQDRGLVVWESGGDQDGFASGVVARRIDSAGNPTDAEFIVNGTTYSSQGVGVVGVLPGGDFVIAWGSLQDPDGSTSTFARRYFFPYSLVIAPGIDSTNPPTVLVTQPDGLETSASFPAFGSAGYGANAGAGDIDGSLAEALAGPGPSPVFGPHVRAFRADGTPVSKVSFYAYGTLRYGVRPAGASIDTDSFAEILTAPGEGAVFGPHIRGFNFDGVAVSPMSKVSFYAYQTLKWGARVAGGDVDGDGIREIVTGPGPGAVFRPHVRGFNYDGTAVQALAKVSFFAFANGVYGATVGASDVESDGYGAYGDGFQELVVGRGPDPGVGAQVRLFDYDAASIAQKYEVTAYASMYGAAVAGGDIDAGDTEEVVTATGADPSATADIAAWEWDPVIGVNPDGARLRVIGPDQFTAFAGMTYGANVAVGTFE